MADIGDLDHQIRVLRHSLYTRNNATVDQLQDLEEALRCLDTIKNLDM